MKHILLIILTLLSLQVVAAFSITTPENTTYDITEIPFSIEANETLDNITYSFGNESFLACTNCTTYNTTIAFEEGEHTIEATGAIDNETYTDSVTFTIDLPEPTPVFSITVLSPEDKTYNTTEVFLEITANETLDSLTYYLDTEVLACENCSGYNETLNLTEGDHELIINGTIDNTTVTETVSFSVVLPEEPVEPNTDFTLTIITPIVKTYDDNLVPVNITANRTLDTITIEIDDDEDDCENCSTYAAMLNLSEGIYTLTATGELGNTTKTTSVTFSIDIEEDNETDDDNETDEPRFTQGYNKLPQMVSNDELTDEELADIIRENKINPGIINRLIKTGKLGNESLDAILDTQFTPPGIFRKLLSWIGIQLPTVASTIAEEYELSTPLQQKIITRDDLPEKHVNKFRNKLREQEHEQPTPAQEHNAYSVGKQGRDFTPPGQAKKASGEHVESEEHGQKTPPGKGKNQVSGNAVEKVPPGQAKKTGGNGNGKSNGKGKNK